MEMRKLLWGPAVAAMIFSLGACRDQGETKAELAPLDDGLTNADPAIKGALEEQIMVDPKLTKQSNTNSITPGNLPADGGVPAIPNSKAAADAEVAARAAAGKLLRAPEPAAFDADCKTCGQRPVTLGAMARDQGGAAGGCDADMRYGNEWANRLPAAFRVYPRALIKEAAGVANGKCNVRVVNFETGASKQAVLDYYYTMARNAGYTTDHRIKGGEHYLGGTRGDKAYVVMLRQEGTGIVDVDIVASGGN